jgi:hypothetical protein
LSENRLKNALKKVITQIPFVYDYLQKRKIESAHLQIRNLLKGKSAPNASSQKSVLHFSINKAATQHVKGVLRRLQGEVKT